jgi:hypothetical protein
MNKLLTGMFAAALSLGLGASVPAMAAPLPGLQSLPTFTGERPLADLHQVQRRTQPGYGGQYRSGPRYWRGHRGYRSYRPGYRRYGGYWYPPAAFIAGAIIGGALAAPPPRGHYRSYHYSPEHVEWCYGRYRSYRASDNTFQPYNGPRRQCRSPYM